MGKKGEKIKSFAAHGFFVLIVILGLYFVATSSVSLTGHAVLDAATAKEKLESALAESALFNQVSDASICVIINDPEQPMSLQAMKSGAGWTVSQMVDYCAGLTVEDIIVQFPDYDSFSQIVENPSPRNLARGAIERDFEILESRYVELGGNVICDASFQRKYCTALKVMAPADQLIEGDLSCCLTDLSRSERKLLEEHLEGGRYKDETDVLEQPGGGFLGLSMTTMMLGAGIVVALILIVVVVLVRGKGKPAAGPEEGAGGAPAEAGTGTGLPGAAFAAVAGPQPTVSKELSDLQNYVNQAMMQGYAVDDIRTHLLEIGWDQTTADSVVEKAQENMQRQ